MSVTPSTVILYLPGKSAAKKETEQVPERPSVVRLGVTIDARYLPGLAEQYEWACHEQTKRYEFQHRFHCRCSMFKDTTKDYLHSHAWLRNAIFAAGFKKEYD